MRHVLLLRGVNVGGKNRLPMADLAALCTELGGQQVQTYIQSGNVVLDLPAPRAADFPAQLQAALAARQGLDVPVVLRSQEALRSVLARLPWPDAPEELLSVAFLAHRPEPARVAALDPHRSLPDVFVVDGAEVFLHTPNGLARTKLTNAWLDSQLRTVSTVRGWRTVRTLAAL